MPSTPTPDSRENRAGAEPRQQAVWELLEASGRGEVERVAAILDEHPDIIDALDALPGNTSRRTALHFGVGHGAVVQLLLERGANPNIRDEGDDAMPLHFAAERGDLDVVRLLVEHGADPVGEGTYHELNVLGWAVCWDYVHNLHVAEYLLAHGAEHTVHTAVAMGDVNEIRAIAARSSRDIDKAMDGTNHRRRPLHLAVVKHRTDSLRMLLDLGANIETTDAEGLTPLDQAALQGDAGIVGLLRDHGAGLRLPAAIFLGLTDDIERLALEEPHALEPGNRYGSLIVRAAERASGEAIERLIRAGASPNAGATAETGSGETGAHTPLFAAAFSGNAAAVEVLMAHGADPNLRERKWCSTPAGWADWARHDRVRDRILEGPIDPFQAIDFDRPDRIAPVARDSPALIERPFRDYCDCPARRDQWYPEPWHTPLAWAVVRNSPEAVRVLLDLGATQIPDPDGRSLLDLSLDAGHDEVAELLRRSPDDMERKS
jgi:ankyrin repeat protein